MVNMHAYKLFKYTENGFAHKKIKRGYIISWIKLFYFLLICKLRLSLRWIKYFVTLVRNQLHTACLLK